MSVLKRTYVLPEATVAAFEEAVEQGRRSQTVVALIGDCKPKQHARHVALEGMDKPYGTAKLKFIRSIPLEKALTSTLLAYEMNGEPLPLAHGFPLRALALGWAGANCCKWLKKIRVLDRPYEGHYMRVYRVFQKGQESKSGAVVTLLPLKSFITQPLPGETLKPGRIVILGTAYAGERTLSRVDVSVDGGRTWSPGIHRPKRALRLAAMAVCVDRWEERGALSHVEQAGNDVELCN